MKNYAYLCNIKIKETILKTTIMKKSISVLLVVWALVLGYTIFNTNLYVNAIIIVLGLIVVILTAAYIFEKNENKKKK